MFHNPQTYLDEDAMGRAANRKKIRRIQESTNAQTDQDLAQSIPRARCQYSLDDIPEAGACPIPKTHSRLQEAHRLWHQALDLYAEPEGFRINLNACIQALRNVTFVLQKEHGGVPNFEHWYANWQVQMKQDAIMRWLVDARNTIVKEGDLETRSHSRVSVIDYYFPTPVFVSEMPPLLTTDMIAARLAASRNVPEALKGKAFIQVERCWVVNTLPDTELLETLAHAYGVLSNVVSKEPRPSRRGFCKPRGNLPPLRYGLPFLPALPSGASWQIFVTDTKKPDSRSSLPGKIKMEKTLLGRTRLSN